MQKLDYLLSRHTNTLLQIILFIAFLMASGYGQTFTKITDPNNPIVNPPGPSGYSGSSWVDFDNDNDLDLFINNSKLYRNDGNETFVELTTDLGNGQNLVTGNGNSWGDYDNDGDLDCFISGANSFLYRNDGGGTFVKITNGDIGDGFANRGWSCAWADFNNDGYLDLAITHPAGFVPGGPAIPNHLFANDGPPNYTFTKIDTGAIVTGLAPYTVGTWSDFDQDGDMDYFVGAGPANGTTATDYLYRNLLKETGNAKFERIMNGVIATDLQDGQVWNWIDYDNDGDLDAYLTNWGGSLGGLANRLYRNDAGTYVRVETGSIVTDVGISLSSVWGDFDNDGDLDCYVTNDGSQLDRYYQNNANGTFTRIDNLPISEPFARRGATAGDYDNDGDLDLLALGPAAASLYRNDTQNGNNWVKFKCEGTTANRSAIGTRVRVKTVINGQPVWQLREVSAQNTFNGHNSLEIHFGAGDATTIDTLIFHWPSGNNFMFINVAVNALYLAREGEDLTLVTSIDPKSSSLTRKFRLYENYPNPFNPSTTIEYALPGAAQVVLKIYNLLGQEVKTLVNGYQNAGLQSVQWDGRDNSGKPAGSGVYIYQVEAGNFVQSKKMVLLK